MSCRNWTARTNPTSPVGFIRNTRIGLHPAVLTRRSHTRSWLGAGFRITVGPDSGTSVATWIADAEAAQKKALEDAAAAAAKAKADKEAAAAAKAKEREEAIAAREKSRQEAIEARKKALEERAAAREKARAEAEAARAAKKKPPQ